MLPKKLEEWVRKHTREGSAMRAEVVKFLERVLSGEKIGWGDIEGKAVRLKVIRMRREGILLLVDEAGRKYFAVNPAYLDRENPQTIDQSADGGSGREGERA